MLCTLLAALALLTDNPKGQAFPADDIRRFSTGCTIEWLTNGPYATERHMLNTRTDSAGRSTIMNGRLFGDGHCCAWGAWGGKPEAGFTIDLKEPYLVSKTVLWSSENQALRGIAGYTVALSLDGKTFTEVGRKNVAADFDGGFGDKIHPVPHECVLENPAVARYVRFLVDKNKGRYQMVFGEVAVFGDLPPSGTDLSAYAPENRRPTVALRVDGFSSGAAGFDWDGFPAAGDVKAWRLYRSEKPFDDTRLEGVKLVVETPAATTSHVLYPLVPKVTNHYAVAAVYANGESHRVKSVAHAPKGALEVTRFRDMLGVNYFWGGGGANSHTKAWYDVAADFLSKSNFRRLRWWISPEWAMKEYMPRRIEVNGWTGEIDVAKKYGIYLHDMGNEPELNPTTTPEANVAEFRKAVAKWRAAGCGAEHKFYGPVVGISDRGFTFFKKWIEAGGAEIADAYDLHTYCGNTSEFVYPEGYSSGSPEAIIHGVKRVRDFLKEKGVDKPLTCSEWGFSDTKTANPHMADPTPLRKAQFLVRGCIIHHWLGFRRIFLYSFYDEGYDPNYSEHTFGVLTRDLQKKPAYFALETMGDVLGDALVTAEMKGLGAGDFGYVFRNVDKPGYVSVVWNGAKDKNGVFRTTPGSVEVVTMFGERRTVRTKDDGTFLAKFDGSPVYFVGPDKVEMVSSAETKKRETEVAGRLAVSADSDVVAFNAGETQTVTFKVKNPLADRVEVMLTLKNLKGETIGERKASIAGGGEEAFAFPAQLKENVLDKVFLTVDYDAEGESFCETRGVWVRVLGEKTGKTTVKDVRFAGVDHPVKALGSDALEITVDPKQGGQILEIWDKRNKTNQLTVDYDKIGTLASIPFAYCLWHDVSVFGVEGGEHPFPSFGRRSVFSASVKGDALVLTSESRGMTLTETMRLDGERFYWSVDAKNGLKGTAKVRWHIHPEYTIAGLADSYQDYMLIPTAKGEFKLVFWSGLGDRRLTDITDGWWRMVDPKAKYEIRQDFVKDEFLAPKLWFGIGSWNVEMYTKIVPVKPGDSLKANLVWQFRQGE